MEAMLFLGSCLYRVLLSAPAALVTPSWQPLAREASSGADCARVSLAVQVREKRREVQSLRVELKRLREEEAAAAQQAKQQQAQQDGKTNGQKQEAKPPPR